MLIVLRTDVIFCTKTSLISYAAGPVPHRAEAPNEEFVSRGQSAPLSYASRRLWIIFSDIFYSVVTARRTPRQTERAHADDRPAARRLQPVVYC